MGRRLQAAKRVVLHRFERIERACAWLLLGAGVATFVGVVFGLIVVGQAKPATLLIAADLIVSGFSAVQEAEDDDGDHPDAA